VIARSGVRSVSVVFPVWNEEDYVERAVREAAAVLESETSDWEIVVVDDGSTDRTPGMLAGLAARMPRLRVLTHARNRTLGAALRTGFAATRKDLVLYSDVDLPFDLRQIGRAVGLLEAQDADLLCAFRLDRTSEGVRRMTYSYVYNALVTSVFDVHIKDINFGFKLLRREVLEAIELRSEGSFIDAELVIKAIHRGFRVIQMGVDYFPRVHGVSTLSSPVTIARILVDLVRLYPETRTPSEPSTPVRRPPAVRAVPGEREPRAKSGAK
jgi:glycosyltransferase involved in cell wall biosynthesis